MSGNLRLVSSALLVSTGLTGFARAQSFVSAPTQIPSGSPFNVGSTENIDFADIDGDGDRDAVKADGGDAGNEQSRLWVNRGGEPGGTIGFFVDRTATQFPSVMADSRDMDFVDIDNDGDFDLYVSNTSAVIQQSNRWWINMGGIQGGTQGFFQDQTSTRWTFIAVNDGVSHFSSIANSAVQVTGGFTDWSCDCVFGDLDNDGDPDLVHTTYGGIFGGSVPSRLFLNNGAGYVEEFNPSHFKLTATQINNGNPGLWCQGNHQHGTTDTTGAQCDIADTPLGVEIGDLDGDLDIDILQGARNEIPRIYRNQLTETGSFTAWRDVTFASGHTPYATSGGNYEQELGDLDNDGDLDIYGLNWPGFDDCTLKNNGAAFFVFNQTLPGSSSDDNEGDWFDYNNDGRMDLYICAFVGQNRLYRNDGPTSSWTHTNVTSSELPSVSDSSLGGDTCDVDNDGDYDVLVANDGGAPEHFYKNVNQIPDAIAPRIEHLEQAPNRASGGAPTVIRAHVYDNSSWDVARYDNVQLEYSWDGTNFYSSKMRFSGGQLFRGEIRGDIAGTIQYRVRGTDEHGNVGLSTTLSYVATGCSGNVVSYCTAGTSSIGCVPSIGATGTPSASASSGFTLSVTNVEGQKNGVFFYGISGRTLSVWKPGSASFLCVKSPAQRMTTTSSGGAAGACNGSFSEDWNAFMSSHPAALGQPLVLGQVIDAQAWYRDPPAAGQTNLSNAIEFTVCN